MRKCPICRITMNAINELLDYLNWMAENHPEEYQQMLDEYKPTKWLEEKLAEKKYHMQR